VPADQVAELLQRWQQAGGVWGRGRVLGDAVRLVAGLSPDERRLLAQAVADEGAPQLAARIEAASGHGVQPTQLQEVVDGLLSLERAQIDHLVATLSDPAERERLASEALTSLVSDVDVPGPPLPPPVPFEPDPTAADDLELTIPDARAAAAAAGLAGVGGLHALARGEIPADDVELADLALGHPGLGSAEIDEPGLGAAGVHEAGLHDVGIYDLDEHAIVHPLPAASGAATGSGLAEAPRGSPAARPEDAPTPPTFLAGATPPAPPVPPTPGRHGRPDATLAADRLVAELTTRSTARERLAALDRDGVGELDGGGVLRVLDAVPEGWQRRRAARRLLDADVLGRARPDQLAARFPGLGDRTFVVGDLLAAALITPEDVDELLPTSAAARLRARSER
jgi:hypothetical protein